MANRAPHNLMREPRVCCGIVFTDSLAFGRHVRCVHKPAELVTCETCGKVCRGQHALNQHQAGMHQPLDPDRFFRHVYITSDCWHWLGCLDSKGYGQIMFHRWRQSVHRVAYEHMVGPIPEGLTLDHLCGRKNCVRPEHLEPVTHTENIRRWARRTGWNGIAGTQRKEPIVVPTRSADPSLRLPDESRNHEGNG